MTLVLSLKVPANSQTAADCAPNSPAVHPAGGANALRGTLSLPPGQYGLADALGLSPDLDRALAPWAGNPMLRDFRLVVPQDGAFKITSSTTPPPTNPSGLNSGVPQLLSLGFQAIALAFGAGRAAVQDGQTTALIAALLTLDRGMAPVTLAVLLGLEALRSAPGTVTLLAAAAAFFIINGPASSQPAGPQAPADQQGSRAPLTLASVAHGGLIGLAMALGASGVPSANAVALPEGAAPVTLALTSDGGISLRHVGWLRNVVSVHLTAITLSAHRAPSLKGELRIGGRGVSLNLLPDLCHMYLPSLAASLPRLPQGAAVSREGNLMLATAGSQLSLLPSSALRLVIRRSRIDGAQPDAGRGAILMTDDNGGSRRLKLSSATQNGSHGPILFDVAPIFNIVRNSDGALTPDVMGAALYVPEDAAKDLFTQLDGQIPQVGKEWLQALRTGRPTGAPVNFAVYGQVDVGRYLAMTLGEPAALKPSPQGVPNNNETPFWALG